MNPLVLIRQLLQHAAWANEKVLDALRRAGGEHPEAWREYAHVLGAEEVWLSRLEGREKRVGVWPTFTADEAERFGRTLAAEYEALLVRMQEEDLERAVSYVTTDGRSFTSAVSDILVHIALHGQYHRGKINLLCVRVTTNQVLPTSSPLSAERQRQSRRPDLARCYSTSCGDAKIARAWSIARTRASTSLSSL